ncbi:hypothetical protein [Paraburkholderia unamae]|uniref:Uncharacterized protein n=1 Tax=Paraburkholderia unamae TaxID=219649 RepID=A0ACC6RGY4_9BURK
MSNLPALFQGNAKLPTFLKNAEPTPNALAAHHTEGFPVLSIKGKNWTVKKGGEEQTLMNPKDPDSPASNIEVVIVKASDTKQKVWYASSYTEGAEMGKPDCFSLDGKKPDPSSEKKQATSCALCKKNQWGSKVNTDGTASKGKACADIVRLAVAPVDDIANPMLLRLPPASIKPAGDYGAMLQKKGVPLEAVITKLRFDKDAPTPKVLFEPVGFLTEQQYNEAKETAETELVEAILGSAPVSESDEPADEAGLGEVPAHLKPAAEKPKATPKPTPAPQPAPEPVAEEDEEAKLLKQLAALKAKKISSEPTVTNAEVEAAVAAGEAGQTVVKAAKVTREVQPEVAVGTVEVDGLPDLSSITFDD